MSEFNCPEPGCKFHIGIAGDLVTDEDFESQDYYDQEIEEHERMHAESASETIQVYGRELGVSHLGMQINVLGSWWTLMGVSTTFYERRGELSVHVGRPGPVPEMLFVDVRPNSLMDLRAEPAPGGAIDPDEKVLKVLRCEECGYSIKLSQPGEPSSIGGQEREALRLMMNLHGRRHGHELDRRNIVAIHHVAEQILSMSPSGPGRSRRGRR